MVKRLIIGIILVSVTASYAWFQFWFNAKSSPHPISFAYANVIQSFFSGEFSSLEADKTSALLTQKENSDCLKSGFSKIYNDVMNPTHKKCILALPLFNQENHRQYCASWKFERCAEIRLNNIFLNDKKRMDKINQIFQNPCAYFPTLKQIQGISSNKGSTIIANLTEDERKTLIDKYINTIQYLTCDSKGKDSIKMIISFDGDSQDSVIIKTITQLYQTKE